MNNSILMALSYVFGQGLYFITLAYLLYTNQKDVAGWLSVKLAYISFILQLSDMGTLNIIAKAWNRKRKNDVDELVLIRGIYSFIAGCLLSFAAFYFGEHDLYFLIFFPFVSAIAGLSRLFEYELKGNYLKTAIIQSGQWISILLACAVDRVLLDSGGLVLYLPLVCSYLIRNKLKIISIKHFNAHKSKQFGPIFIIGITGQIWGRLIIQLIYSYHGPATASIYSLARGILSGLVKFTSNFLRPIFLKFNSNNKLGNYSFSNSFITKLCLSQIILVVILFIISSRHEIIIILLWPIWTIYTWHTFQWLYRAAPNDTLRLEIIGTIISIVIFLYLYKINPYVATFASDAAKSILLAAIVLLNPKRLT